jgi:hypothetical protein
MPLGRTFSTQNTTVFFQVNVHTHRVDKMVVINTISETGSWESNCPYFLRCMKAKGQKIGRLESTNVSILTRSIPIFSSWDHTTISLSLVSLSQTSGEGEAFNANLMLFLNSLSYIHYTWEPCSPHLPIYLDIYIGCAAPHLYSSNSYATCWIFWIWIRPFKGLCLIETELYRFFLAKACCFFSRVVVMIKCSSCKTSCL